MHLFTIFSFPICVRTFAVHRSSVHGIIKGAFSKDGQFAIEALSGTTSKGRTRLYAAFAAA